MSSSDHLHYTVYLSETDEVVASGKGIDCADQMGVLYDSFKSLVCKTGKGILKKYVFVVENLNTGEMVQKGE